MESDAYVIEISHAELDFREILAMRLEVFSVGFPAAYWCHLLLLFLLLFTHRSEPKVVKQVAYSFFRIDNRF